VFRLGRTAEDHPDAGGLGRAGLYKVGASSSERFGGSEFMKPAAKTGGGNPHGGGAPTSELKYDVPAGWVELPPTAMRQVNLEPAGNPRPSAR
jgi:hypothetical protein